MATDLRKAAILLSSLPSEDATQLSDRLALMQQQTLAAEIASLADVSSHERCDVLREFLRSESIEALADSGQRNLSVFPRSTSSDTGNESPASDHWTPFEFLTESAPYELRILLENEHPQTIALILSCLPSRFAGEVLGGFDSSTQIQLIRRIANISEVSVEVIRQVEYELERRMCEDVLLPLNSIDGLDVAAEILKQLRSETADAILLELEALDPYLVLPLRGKLESGRVRAPRSIEKRI